MQSTMQDYPLTVTAILRRGETVHRNSVVQTLTAYEPASGQLTLQGTTYADIAADALTGPAYAVTVACAQHWLTRHLEDAHDVRRGERGCDLYLAQEAPHVVGSPQHLGEQHLV